MWFKSKKQKDEERIQLKQQLLAEIEQENLRKEQERREQEERIRMELEAKRAEEEALRQKVEEELKAAEEPWVDIKGIAETKEGGVNISLDWNQAFVDYLKSNGYRGKDDEDVIRRWLAVTSQSIVDRLEKDSSESEFE